MTWLERTKIQGLSDLVGTRTVPTSVRVLAQTASASADYETAIWTPLEPTFDAGLGGGVGTNIQSGNPYSGILETHKIMGAFLLPDAAITGGGATVQATAKIRLYDDTGTLVGTLYSLLFTTGVNATQFLGKSLGTAITTLRAASNLVNGFGIREDETLTFEWVQSATTGLALPAATVILDIV